MANTLLNTKLLTREFLMLLVNNLTLTPRVNRKFEGEFGRAGAKVGDTINVRLPVQFDSTLGRIANIQDVQERSVPVVVDKQRHVAFQFSSAELALDISDFSDRYLKSAAAKLANDLDADGLREFLKVYQTVGESNTIADTLRTWLRAGVYLDNSGTPRDDQRYVVAGPATQAGLVDSLKGLFQSSTEISKQYTKGVMGTAGGFDFTMSQNVVGHTFGSGVADPVKINGASQVGSNLVITGLVGNLKAGDTFTIDGVFAVNNMSKESTGLLQQFVVLEDVTTVKTSVKVSPAIEVSGPYKNVSGSPLNNAAIKFKGEPNATVEVNAVFHKDALTLVCVELPLPTQSAMAARATDEQLGLSVRWITQYNANNDLDITRIDILYGWKLIRPEMAVKVFSDSSKF